MLSLRRRLLFCFALGDSGDNPDGSTGRAGAETTSERTYDPDNQVNDSTVTYTSEVGQPKVHKDSSGNISSYEFTSESTSSSGSTYFDTGVLALDGNPFTLTLKCTFSYSDNSSTYYPTLLNALEEVSPWYGFLIRYEGSQLYFVYESTHYTMSTDSSGGLDITITYDSNKKMTVTNNGTTVASFTYSRTVSNLNFVLCSSLDDSGTTQRHAVATITEFKVEKT